MAEETVTSIQQPWTVQQPFLEDVFNKAQGLYGTNATQYFPDSTVAPLGDTTNQALNLYEQQATAGSPIFPAAQNQLAGTLQGDFLNSNPYLDGMFDQASRAVTRNYSQAVAPGIGAQFDSAGRFGSGLYQNAMANSQDRLAENLGGLASNIYGQNYQQERARQMQGLSLAPQIQNQGYLDASQLLNVGQLRDEKTQQGITDDFNRYQYNQTAPWEDLGRYSGLVQGNYGGEGSTTTPLQENSLAQNIGLGLTGLGLFNEVGGLSGIGGLLGF